MEQFVLQRQERIKSCLAILPIAKLDLRRMSIEDAPQGPEEVRGQRKDARLMEHVIHGEKIWWLLRLCCYHVALGICRQVSPNE